MGLGWHLIYEAEKFASHVPNHQPHMMWLLPADLKKSRASKSIHTNHQITKSLHPHRLNPSWKFEMASSGASRQSAKRSCPDCWFGDSKWGCQKKEFKIQEQNTVCLTVWHLRTSTYQRKNWKNMKELPTMTSQSSTHYDIAAMSTTQTPVYSDGKATVMKNWRLGT